MAEPRAETAVRIQNKSPQPLMVCALKNKKKGLLEWCCWNIKTIRYAES